jgi:O-antigen ligase
MLLDKLKKILIFLLVATIPIARIFNINTYVIAAFSFVVLFSLKKNFFSSHNSITILFYCSFLVFFLNLMIVGETNILLLLLKYIPLILIPSSLLFVNYEKKVLDGFIYSVVCCCIISIVDVFIKSKGYIFYYHNPTELLDIQANYLGIFVCFALSIMYSEILEANVAKLKHYILFPILFFSLAFLFNRTAIIVTIVISFSFAVLYLNKTRNIKFLIGFLFFFLTATTWVIRRPIMQSKFKELVQIDVQNTTVYDNGISSRLLSWNCSIDAIKNIGFYGNGVAGTKEILNDCYRTMVGDEAVQIHEEYNAHNQFLQIFLENGYLGLVVFIFIFGCILYGSIKNKDYLLFSYFLIMLIFGMTESFMVRQWGLIFFTFFTPYLLNRWDADKR